jgi:hypothetical protein
MTYTELTKQNEQQAMGQHSCPLCGNGHGSNPLQMGALGYLSQMGMGPLESIAIQYNLAPQQGENSADGATYSGIQSMAVIYNFANTAQNPVYGGQTLDDYLAPAANDNYSGKQTGYKQLQPAANDNYKLGGTQYGGQ